MPAFDVYGIRRAMEVREDTWGHLAPVPRRKYRGTILFAESEYGGQGRTIIRTDFPGLAPSPWFYDAMCEYIDDLEGPEDGQVYRWSGTYEFFRGRKERGGRDRYLDESRYRFTGTSVLVPTGPVATRA